jgi:hypothetical protein
VDIPALAQPVLYLFLDLRLQQVVNQLLNSNQSAALPSTIGISQGIDQTSMHAALSSDSAPWWNNSSPSPCQVMNVMQCNVMLCHVM